MLIVLTASLLILYAIFFLYCKPSVLYVLFAFEIILLGTNFIFAQNSYDMDDLYGQGVALILFSAAAVDTSIGLIAFIIFNVLFYLVVCLFVLLYYGYNHILPRLGSFLKLRAKLQSGKMTSSLNIKPIYIGLMDYPLDLLKE